MSTTAAILPRKDDLLDGYSSMKMIPCGRRRGSRRPRRVFWSRRVTSLTPAGRHPPGTPVSQPPVAAPIASVAERVKAARVALASSGFISACAASSQGNRVARPVLASSIHRLVASPSPLNTRKENVNRDFGTSVPSAAHSQFWDGGERPGGQAARRPPPRPRAALPPRPTRPAP